ncbi:MAG: SDR family NAD(P)-dependent oxidoreductase [Ornithinimicrobium sp.]|jgi:NAD(P)-dependent dehydrogenase (short-subunit alcohol dehydrogenase family)|uniref:SDR family NAD(P)-dependent oxidoreductase n=1 Tax=Ornithinimicrobium sp. TaxID=1977084 RepID=UPI003D9B8F48
MAEFSGLTAVVTGGASGIGEAVCHLLQARGATVYAIDRQEGTTRGGVRVLAADVTDDDAVEAAVAAIVDRAGGLDILVNNAGIGAAGTVADNSIEEWRLVFDVNVYGTVRMTRAALPHLRRSAAAVVVNTCSVAAEVGLPQRALYSASKGAVLALTRAMAADHVSDNVRVCCVNPGTADTPWVSRLLDASEDPTTEREALQARQPTGRLVSADEVAHAVAGLASPLASATTGVALTVDGGLTGLRLPAD